EASIGDGATVHAGGNVALAAGNGGQLVASAGAGAFGATGGGGGSNGTPGRTATPQAFGGKNATGTPPGGQGRTPRPTGDGVTSNFWGLSVTATENTNLVAASVGAGGGSTAGIAGSATVAVLTDITKAYVDQGTAINPDNTGAGPNQSINLLAADDTA